MKDTNALIEVMNKYLKTAADADNSLGDTMWNGNAAICAALNAIVVELRNIREQLDSRPLR